MVTNDLVLQFKEVEFKDEKTGEVKKFIQYYVSLFGIDVVLNAKDSTGKQLLNKHFKKGE